MTPGPDAIRVLANLHPTARWGYCGRRTGDGQHEFALLEVYPKHEAKTKFYEPWNGRGPVFGAPFDSMTHEPLWLWTFSQEDVESQRFVPLIRRWTTSMKQRMLDSAKERGKKFHSEIDDLAGEMGSHMFHRMKHSYSSPAPVAKKFLTQDEKDRLSGDAHRDLSDEFNPFRQAAS